MSSTLSNTEVQTIPKKEWSTLDNNNGKRFHRLVRTTSLEKIRRFNTYICSQQYYILPSILLWLKTSQNSLHTTIEKTIFLFRSIIFVSTIYKLSKIDFRSNIKSILLVFLKQLQSQLLLKTFIYTICLLLLMQICLCFYLFVLKGVTYGLLFLITAWFYVNYLHYRTFYFYQNNRLESKKL